MSEPIQFTNWPEKVDEIIQIQAQGEKKRTDINGETRSYITYKNLNYLHSKKEKSN